MNVRRTVAALSVSAALCGAAVAPAAFADDSARPKGLYGAKDPKFDGVWRQSLALLAQDAVGVTPAKSAVDWLAGQQCADGGFAAYRADPAKACGPKTGEFTDATSAAVQALAAVGGRSDAVEKGIGWLKRNQNDNGGWGMNPGGPSDANSTSVAVGAFAAAAQDPAKTASAKGRKSPYDALLGLQLGCAAKTGQRGAFAYQPDKSGDKDKLAANNMATVSAALATQGKGFVFETVGKDNHKNPKPLDCKDAGRARTPQDATEAALAHLSLALSAHDMRLMSSMAGATDQPDFGATADAVVALAAGEHSAAAGKPLHWLQSKDSGAAAWSKGEPGALAKLILAAHAAGGDPRDFGGVDLVRQLNATGPKPEAAAGSGAESATKDKKDDDGDGDGGMNSVWWIVGAGAAAGMGIGFLLSGRKKQRL
ncbi:prenyltransferase/squalene oxidase repeat-containing protein [Streptomyces sp. NPDC005393]|uniref:prenyltransferase/squalene oxidase repeat-containing protein n=1 Tax=Streptomyces sp. NPDC005393 TaxID=3157041 RepID=UPI0033AB5CC2